MPPDPREEGESEGAVFKGVTRPSRRTPAAIALAAIAVLAIALLTKLTDPAPSDPTDGVTAQPSPTEAVTSSAVPTLAATPSPASVPPSRNPAVTPLPTFRTVPAEAGATQLVPAGPTPVRLTISLPDGWQKASDFMYVKSNGVAPAGMSIGAWVLKNVYTFPCRWSTQEFADGPFMRTAEGQAEALSAWWGQDPNMLPYWNSKIAPLASKRQPTTIQGYAAWYLEVLIPSELDFGECDGGELVFWVTANDDIRYSLGPGELNRLWVVDVAGQLIVIDAASFLATSSADVTELQAIIDSIVIEP